MKVRKYEGNVREMVGKLEESCGPILARCLKAMHALVYSRTVKEPSNQNRRSFSGISL